MNVIITIGTAIAITLLLFTVATFPPMSTSAQNMTENMTSSNTTQGASVENMTGKISSSDDRYYVGTILEKNPGLE